MARTRNMPRFANNRGNRIPADSPRSKAIRGLKDSKTKYTADDPNNMGYGVIKEGDYYPEMNPPDPAYDPTL